MTNYTAQASIVINGTPAQVWSALTDPAKVKEYMFGTDMTAEWKVGGTITYKGEWEGKAYEDTGTILELEPNKILKNSYWSNFSGTPDVPENRMIITSLLEEVEGGTKLTIIQENNASADSAEHSGSNWKMILEKIKGIVEKK
jgi:uncharacterized protein YndB with AHSA1/START domain